MGDGQKIDGQCLCGAVTIAAIVDAPTLVACHCGMCQRQNGGPYISIMTRQEGIEADGPITVFKSSDWAERAFCSTCGSTLWYGTLHDGARYLSSGLFADAAGAHLALEYFSDNCPQGYMFKGDHRRMTEAETIAAFTEGGEPGV